MIYNDLPKWAQKQVKQWVKDEFLKIDDEARHAGEHVPYYTDEELESLVMNYLNDFDGFSIVYDEETDMVIVSYCYE